MTAWLEELRQQHGIGRFAWRRLCRGRRMRRAIARDDRARVAYIAESHAHRNPLARLTRTARRLMGPPE